MGMNPSATLFYGLHFAEWPSDELREEWDGDDNDLTEKAQGLTPFDWGEDAPGSAENSRYRDPVKRAAFDAYVKRRECGVQFLSVGYENDECALAVFVVRNGDWGVRGIDAPPVIDESEAKTKLHEAASRLGLLPLDFSKVGWFLVAEYS